MDSDEDKQSGVRNYQNQPYDESLEVPDAEDVPSIYSPVNRNYPGYEAQRSRGNTPPQADSRMSDQSDDEFETGAPQMGGPSQQQQPLYGQHDVDDDEDDDEDDDDDDESDEAPEQATPGGPMRDQRIQPGLSQLQQQPKPDGDESSEEEDDDDDDDDDDDEDGNEQVEGAYDPADYEHLAVIPEIKELFQYITRYTPQTIELDHKLKPFIPDYIPAVGDIDAFIKIPRPDQKTETLGLTVLDEPCAKQSDPTVLDLQLRAVSKQSTVKQVAVKSIDGSEKNTKAIDNWISSLQDLHRHRPPPNVHYTKNMPDIDSLMQEWPPEFEEMLKEVSLPTADTDCDLATYADMICALLDIPVHKSRIQSLHVLFTLYSAFKNSQHFRGLADENQLDNALKPQGEDDRLEL